MTTTAQIRYNGLTKSRYRWIVRMDGDTSEYAFASLAEAQDFADRYNHK